MSARVPGVCPYSQPEAGIPATALILGCQDGAMASNNQRFFPANGYFPAAVTATEADVEGIISKKCIMKTLRVSIAVAPGAGKQYVIGLRRNGADTALAVTIADAATEAENTVNQVTFNPGDRICMHQTPTGTPVAGSDIHWCYEVAYSG